MNNTVDVLIRDQFGNPTDIRATITGPESLIGRIRVHLTNKGHAVFEFPTDVPEESRGQVTISYVMRAFREDRVERQNLRPRPDPRKLRAQRKVYQSVETARFKGR